MKQLYVEVYPTLSQLLHLMLGVILIYIKLLSTLNEGVILIYKIQTLD